MSSQALTAGVHATLARDTSRPQYEIADVFRLYGDTYCETHKLSPEQARAMRDIARCRTSALGGHIEQCEHCGHIEISYNSCRNSNCPKCGAIVRARWVEAREQEVLPIQYFHFVFTLPEALVALARYNPELLYGLLFRAAADTLQAFADRRWGGKLGIVMVLHTWGQTLNDHPHVHCIVTGGALKHDASAFVQAPKSFLFHVEALSAVFRGKYIEALEKLRSAGKLDLRGQPELGEDAAWQGLRKRLYEHDWVVYAKQPFAEPSHLIRYLGRYVNRIAISNHRLISIDGGQIRFRYKDNRVKDANVERIMCLDAEEFIRRWLSHVPRPGFHRIRYYGFLAGSRRKDNLARIRALLGVPETQHSDIAEADADLPEAPVDPTLCPKCKIGHMHKIEDIPAGHDPPAIDLKAA